MRAKNLVSRGFLVTIAAACVVFTASRAAATMDEVALVLKDSIALIGSA